MKKQNHPVWLAFAHNASAFNEEAGEISLSTLARMIVGDPARADVKHTSQLYMLQRKYVTLFDVKFNEADLKLPFNPEIADVRSGEGKHVFSFMDLFIRRNIAQSFRSYRGSHETWMSAKPALLHAITHDLIFTGDSTWDVAEMFFNKCRHGVTARDWSSAILASLTDRKASTSRNYHVPNDDVEIEEPAALQNDMEDIDDSESDCDDLGIDLFGYFLGGLPIPIANSNARSEPPTNVPAPRTHNVPGRLPNSRLPTQSEKKAVGTTTSG